MIKSKQTPEFIRWVQGAGTLQAVFGIGSGADFVVCAEETLRKAVVDPQPGSMLLPPEPQIRVALKALDLNRG